MEVPLEYTNEDIRAEILIRGRFLMMSCDIEYTLLNIMAFSAPDPQNQIRRFKKMMMKEKIDCTIHDLKHYKPHFYTEYKEWLDKLDEFRLLRNHLAHHKMDFVVHEGERRLRFVYVNEEEGVEGLMFDMYKPEYILEKVGEYMLLNQKLGKLWMTLKEDYDKVHPLVHPNAPKEKKEPE